VTDAGRDQKFRPEDRIRRRAEFDQAYALGKRIPSRSFTFIAHAAGHGRPRLGVTVSRAVGNAVKRNRVRRRLREAFRRNRAAIRSNVDIVLHVRPGAARVRFAKLEEEFLGALRRYGDSPTR
jgi:ribonuclease P protein component